MKFVSQFQIDRQAFIVSLDNIENEARKLGMFETMHAINKAKNAAGTELAYLVERREKSNRAASRAALESHCSISTAK